MPSPRASSWPALPTSSSESSGKSSRHGSPVAGLIDAGPLDPLQLPSEFTQITNQRLLSMALPGPMMSSHQPDESSMALLAACALGDSPVRISTALSRAAFSAPQVSYATCAPCNWPPRFIPNGGGRAKYWRASAMADLRQAESARLTSAREAAK